MTTVLAKRSVTVMWLSARGAGCMRMFDDAEKLWAFLNSLRHDAVVRSGSGEKVGGVERRDDGERRKWYAWFDPEQVG